MCQLEISREFSNKAVWNIFTSWVKFETSVFFFFVFLVSAVIQQELYYLLTSFIYIYLTVESNRISLPPSSCGSHVMQFIYRLSSATEHTDVMFSTRGFTLKMLLTDRFLSSHRLEWLCLFLGCGLGQWLVLNARCLTAGGYTHSLQEAGVASRGRCSLNGVIGVFPLLTRGRI